MVIRCRKNRTRALAGRGALWGNHGYEAAYPMTYTDADGDQLDGHNRYTLTLNRTRRWTRSGPSPCTTCPTSTWSPTRSAGTPSATAPPGLRRGADGSLTIVIQHRPPPDTSNWLPAPAAPFRPLMRLYQPQPAILDGTYKIPPSTKAAS